ncbi:MAG: sugar phosphate isomerase/epimerase family protein [Anaerolineae bacterium]
MNFALSTGTLYVYPLRTVLRWARQAAFDTVELVINPEAIARGGWAVRRMAEAEGISIHSVHPTLMRTPGWWERRGGMERTIPFACETRASTLVMHTPRAESLECGEGLVFRQRIERWQPRLAGSGLQLAVENKAVRSRADLGYALTPPERLRAFADRYDLGLVLDTTHAGTAGEDLLRVQRLFDGRLVNVHLSDMGGWTSKSPLSRLGSMVGEHRFPGAGDLSLADLLQSLARGGYAGFVTLEVNPFAVRFWWPRAVRRQLARALDWMEQAADG